MFLADEDRFARRLLAWYDRNRRDLPWRVPLGARPDPYRILLSETMLQQTQVATVLPYFQRFLSHLPTLAHLASAEEQVVLKLWQGLGYYSRARNLRAAAARIMTEHAGEIPKDVDSLLRLPGIGRYTAGAVASIAYDTKAPIVDGNVARVLCRLDKITADPKDRRIQQLLWQRAEHLLPGQRAGDFNSAMMELGSTVCTPRKPQCLICPVREHCEAHAAGLQDSIPTPRKSKPTPLFLRQTFCLRRLQAKQASWLIEQRPPSGRWAGLWQFVTVAARDKRVTSATIELATGIRCAPPVQLAVIEHALTHRRYRFDIYGCEVRDRRQPSAGSHGPRRWVRLADLPAYPLPRPHARIAEMLAAWEASDR